MSGLLAEKRRLLAEQIELARRASDALEHSWAKLSPEVIGAPDPDLQETLEAMTARFARLEDILIKRVFRAVVAAELADAERLLDVLDLMARLGIIESTEQWIALKELRNIIVHEYELDDLPALQRRVYQATPMLRQTLEAVARYAAGQDGGDSADAPNG
ncbi:HepT-like ribonuclease domain-containing protein [Thiohalocapsa sp. ML1]|uniref:HepT-like ribonuclease domain-containing protein n=1 Tax=Thiohalocapsa sp. ML1 TaxID=1431688 RepID=UPI0012E33CE6|nr:HepT-like ribonuclease domain-containing protein [Thiohalocapsa sp. ML1]